MFAARLERLQAWIRSGRVLVLAPALLLVACGGGGGGGAPANTNSYDLDATSARAYTTGVSFNGLTTTAPNGLVMTMALSIAPQADALFEGTLRKVALQTITLSAPGVAPETLHATEYFSIGPFRTYGSIDDTGTYGVFTAAGTLPTAAHVGDAGPLSTDVYYADAGKTAVTMNATTTWEMHDDGSTATAWACSKTVARQVGSNSDLFQTLCFRINAAGAVLAAKVVLTTPVGTFEFK